MDDHIQETIACPDPPHIFREYYIKEISHKGEDYFCFLPYRVENKCVLISEKLYNDIKKSWEKCHQTILVIHSATKRSDGVLVPDANGLSYGESFIE